MRTKKFNLKNCPLLSLLSKLTRLELFVVKNFLDGDHLPSVAQLSSVDDAKCSFADHFDVLVRYFFFLIWSVPANRRYRDYIMSDL